MARRTEALPEETMRTMLDAGMRFLIAPTDFDEIIQRIAACIVDSLEERSRAEGTRWRFGAGWAFRATLKGLGAGIAIGKHIERQRRAARQEVRP